MKSSILDHKLYFKTYSIYFHSILVKFYHANNKLVIAHKSHQMLTNISRVPQVLILFHLPIS